VTAATRRAVLNNCNSPRLVAPLSAGRRPNVSRVRIHLIGAGGFAREVLDVIEALSGQGQPLTVAAIYADGGSDDVELAARGYQLAGSLGDVPVPGLDDRFVIGFGNPAGRERVDLQLRAAGWRALSLVHPDASVGSGVILGDGTILCAGARVTTNVTFGRHVQVNLNTTVGHDVVVEDYVTLNPLVSISGRVTVGRRTLVGTGANVIEALRIGADAIVGAGAVVIGDVAAATTVGGVPARVLSTRHG
jgi:sugar O-acyltransferase (sialic acid O-acetyltransferase NeuD family)